MPRFEDAQVTCLKRAMLTKAKSGFLLDPADVEQIVHESGLNKSQVLTWGDLFRLRYKTEQERLSFLQADPREKPETSVKNNRFFVTCFNVSVSFAQTYKFPKSRGGGEFTIKYLEAAFNQEACSGEFFIEFDESVWEHKLVESFELGGSGACQVMCVTFNSNDKNESASNALFRVLESQKKTGLSYRRGTIPPALLAKVQAKQEAVKNLSADKKEVDEKTASAMQESLKLNYAKLETIDTNVQSQGVKLDGIQEGVCQVIPDYQKKIDFLEYKLAHQTWLADSAQGKLAYKTRTINQHETRIAQLEQNELDHIAERQAWITEKADLLQQLETKRNMYNLMDNLKHIAGLLSTTLDEERACKRARESN